MHDLTGAMNRLQVNWAILTPSVATLLHPHELPRLKFLVLVGEAVRPDNVSRWADHVALMNGYGPAECTIQSSIGFLTPSSVAGNIGKGLGDLLWIADPGNHNLLTPVVSL
jgi:non-ribosomal peptide synthetase component F